MRRNKRTKHLTITEVTPTTNLVMSIIIAIVALIFILPIWMILAMSLTTDDSYHEFGVQLWPSEWSVDAYKYLFMVGGSLWRSYANTFFYATADTFCHLFFSSMFGFALARRELKARGFLAKFLYGATLFGGGIAPTYILYTRILNIDNTIWVYLLPSMVSAGTIYTLRVFVAGGLDQALLESAKLDGASEFQIYYKICLPLLKAGLATCGLSAFSASWNDWFTGAMYVQDQRLQPIMTYLTKIERTITYMLMSNPQSATVEGQQILSKIPQFSTRMAITVIAVTPLLCCYPFFQRYFIKGVTSGSVKG